MAKDKDLIIKYCCKYSSCKRCPMQRYCEEKEKAEQKEKGK